MNFTKRCWVEISIDNLIHNLNLIKKTSDTEVMCVVKSNAYGHGDLTVVDALQKAGVCHFAVATISEAVRLRKNGCKGEILVIGGYLDDCFEDAIRYDVSLACYDLALTKRLSDYALAKNTKVKVHIKLNTGMTRLGFDITNEDEFNESVFIVKQIADLRGVKLCGAFTHFAVSDEKDGSEYTLSQQNLLKEFKAALKKENVNIPLWHSSNSGAIVNYHNYNLDMVRAGILLYGLYDSYGADSSYYPVLSLKTVITQIREVNQNVSVSYGRTFITQKSTKLATLAIGYADGLPRLLSNKGSVIINGKPASIVGRVCMDQIIVDVTDIDCNVGDTVTVIGKQGDFEITAGDIANLSETINYEIVCGISMRVPRVYIKNGNIDSITEYI